VEGVVLGTGRGRGAIVPGLFPDDAVCYLWSMFEGGAMFCPGSACKVGHGIAQVHMGILK
jgi:hypothetical protein